MKKLFKKLFQKFESNNQSATVTDAPKEKKSNGFSDDAACNASPANGI
jgi:hypothetical protein